MSKSVKFIGLIGLILLIGLISNRIKAPSSVFYNLPAKKLPTTTLFLAGDIMLSRNVAKKMYQAKNFILPFQKVAAEINKTDIAFANLESPFNDTGGHAVDNSLVFNADPGSLEGLKFAGFDVLSTANNHAFDQGLTGIEFTKNLLKKNNILAVGTFLDGEPLSASLPHAISKNGTNYSFLSYTYASHNDGGITHDQHVSDFSLQDHLPDEIEAEKRHGADIVIVNMHAGVEYTRKPTQAQINFAHAAIDAGADLVVGEHPHWIQTVEQYKGKWIFYSLGNFVFDQMWSQETREGLTVKISFANKEIKKIELAPVIIDDFCCARWADLKETTAILNKINLTSDILFQK